MAKNNNLTDFLTDLANAIRAKKGTSAPINPQNFSAEIASIQTGGGEPGGDPAPAVDRDADVLFMDYDGTPLYGYSKEQFLGLSELPAPPQHAGLMTQNWNWDLGAAQTYVAQYGKLDIGVCYTTDDSCTRLYISIADSFRTEVPLFFAQTASGGVQIDWGDGSEEETVDGTGKVSVSHYYASAGEYVISMKVNSGTLSLGHDSSSYCVMGPTTTANRLYCSMLKRVEIGSGITEITAYAFSYCLSLRTITIPEGITLVDNSVFNYCVSLESAVIPYGVTKCGQSTFYYCYSLKSVSLPETLTSIGATMFQNCYSLMSIKLPEGITTTGVSMCASCNSLEYAILPNTIATMSNSAFSNCWSLTKHAISSKVKSIGSQTFVKNYALMSLKFPSTLTSISSQAFSDCLAMKLYDFSEAASVPSLGATSVFSNIPGDCQIVVPDELYDVWIAATNWSSFVDYIVKASEYYA